MDPHPANRHSSETALERIVAMLLALADLAERAGQRTFVVRTLVLWLLRPAEATARRFVTDVCGDMDIAPLPLSQDGDSSTAAIRLALSFRALAAALASLPEWTFEDRDGFASQSGSRWPRLVARRLRDLHDACEALRPMPAGLAPERRDSS